MRRFRILVRPFLLFAGLGIASSGLALPNRVFVSARSGNDANSCDNILTPCQTFQGAVNQVAAGGEVIALDSGGYGKVSIAKAVKIEAPPGIVAFIHPTSGVSAVSISAGASDVVILRGLVLSVGDDRGIFVHTGGEVRIENCVIDGFALGIEVDASGQVVVADTIIRNSVDNGINLSPNAGSLTAVIERCRLDRNFNGLEVGNVSPGTTRATIRDSVVVGQANVGLRADTVSGAISELNVENCLVVNNGTGIFSFQDSGGTTTVRVSNTTVTDNAGFGVNNFVGQILTRSNNTVEGNGTNGVFTGTYTAK